MKAYAPGLRPLAHKSFICITLLAPQTEIAVGNGKTVISSGIQIHLRQTHRIDSSAYRDQCSPILKSGAGKWTRG